MTELIAALLIAFSGLGVDVPVPVECTLTDDWGTYCALPEGGHYDEPGYEDGVVLSNGQVICPEGWDRSFDETEWGDIWSACM